MSEADGVSPTASESALQTGLRRKAIGRPTQDKRLIEKLSPCPARYRSRFCTDSAVRFTDCMFILASDPTDESVGYYQSSAARTQSQVSLFAFFTEPSIINPLANGGDRLRQEP